MKKVILVDMDGVLVKEPTKEHEEEKRKKMSRKGRKEGTEEHHQLHWSDIPDIFLDLEPMDGAIDIFNKLSQDYDMYIVSTAPWNNPSAWADKKRWIDKYLPGAHKRLILTHNKQMIVGDYLIDDRLRNGANKFPGKLIHFGQPPFENWNKVIDYFDKL